MKIQSMSSTSEARILVVDDEPVNRLVLKQILESNGYEVYEASSGQSAVSQLLEQSYDLVLMDLEMPGMNGVQAVRLVRQFKTQLQLPVIMVTSKGSCDSEAFREGFNDYIKKPADKEVVLARVNLHLQLKRAQDSLLLSEERYALAAAGSNDGLWDWQLAKGTLYCSDRMQSMLGLPAKSLKTVTEWFDLIHEEDASRVQKDLNAHFCGESDHFETELRLLHQSSGYRWMLCRGLAVRDLNGKVIRIAGSLTDITEGKVADALTGLPNRLLFVDRVQRCVEQAKRYPSRRFAILYLDVDGFKLINDSYGHEVGDEYLIAIAKRLETAVRSSDSVVSRLGGDEFAVLVENLKGTGCAEAVANRIIKSLSGPIRIKNRELFARASIGIAMNRGGEPAAEEMIREADVAMYFAKENSHLPYKVFEPQMASEAAERLEMSSELRNALSKQEMSLRFQPIVDLRNGATAGFEALVRWSNSKLGNVSPEEFIPLAEESGLIVNLGSFVIRTACAVASELSEIASEPLFMSVNVSMRQMISDDLLDVVSNALKDSGLMRHQLKLEVTETAVMDDPDECIELLEQLRALGVSIGLDDFGTGYSSLAYLHRLPLNVLKIDRSFVAAMFSSAENMAIIETILTLGKSLGLEVIAEGVETRKQLERLRDLGCRYVQGFLFSKPVYQDEVSGLVNYDWFGNRIPSWQTKPSVADQESEVASV